MTTVVTISIGRDSKGNEVTECSPQAVALDPGDKIVWKSVEGSHSVTIQDCGNPAPVLGGPWAGKKGELSNEGTRNAGAVKGFYAALATLKLEGGKEIPPGGAILIVK